jgi:hypothetical protein
LTSAGIPLEPSLLGRAMDFAPHLLRKPLGEAIEHRHFAEALYRAAIADGVTARIMTIDVTAGDAA